MDLLRDEISSEELQQLESTYKDKHASSTLTSQVKFEYAWGLVRSKYPADIKKGILLLEELCLEGYDIRECLYYLAIGNARVKEYCQALKFCRKCLELEPGNRQVKELEGLIKSKMGREGKVGVAITVSLAVIVTAIGMGFALAKPR